MTLAEYLIHFSLMPTRREELNRTLEGLQTTGVPLIAQVNGQLTPAGFSDDIGLYYIIPGLSRTFDISIDQAATIFFGFILVLGWLFGVMGFWLIFTKPLTRFITLIGLSLFSWYSLTIGDIYVIAAMLPVAVIPLFLAIRTRQQAIPWLGLSYLLFGFLFGIAHTLRSQSATAVMLFILVVILGQRLTFKQRLLPVVFLVSGILIVQLVTHQFVQQRDTYLAAHLPAYQPVAASHPFWHTVYIGFGYLNNSRGIIYQDEFAIQTVQAINPSVGYLSTEYETILREQVIRLIHEQPNLVITTIFAKLGVIGLYFFTFANLGLIAFWKKPLPRVILLAFVISLTFSGLSAVLALPVPSYLLGFSGVATVFGILCLNHWLEPSRLSESSR